MAVIKTMINDFGNLCTNFNAGMLYSTTHLHTAGLSLGSK